MLSAKDARLVDDVALLGFDVVKQRILRLLDETLDRVNDRTREARRVPTSNRGRPQREEAQTGR